MLTETLTLTKEEIDFLLAKQNEVTSAKIERDLQADKVQAAKTEQFLNALNKIEDRFVSNIKTRVEDYGFSLPERIEKVTRTYYEIKDIKNEKITIHISERFVDTAGRGAWRSCMESRGYQIQIIGLGWEQEKKFYTNAKKIVKKITDSEKAIEYKQTEVELQAKANEFALSIIKEKHPTAACTYDKLHQYPADNFSRPYSQRSEGWDIHRIICTFPNGLSLSYNFSREGSVPKFSHTIIGETKSIPNYESLRETFINSLISA